MKFGLAFAFALIAAVFFLAPNLSPHRSLFGVPVPPDFRATSHGRRAIMQFRFAIAMAFLAGLLATLVAPVTVGSALAPPFSLCAVGAVMFFWENRQLQRFAAEPQLRQPQLELSPEPDRIPKTLWLSLLPITSLLATTVYLRANWNSIPLRFPIHWNAAGAPDSWGERTLRGVYGQLAFSAMFVFWLLIVNLVLWSGVRRSKYRSYTFHVLTGTQLLFGFVSPLIGLAPLFHLSPTILSSSLLTAAGALVFFAILGAMRANADLDFDPPPPENAWNGGFLYFNRHDPALAAPRRDGMGYAPNLAHPSVWFVFLAPLLILFVSVRWIF